jgi:hypothetical protein
MSRVDSCSYIATSSCKAPTVDMGTVVSKESDKALAIYKISYFEYSMLSEAEGVN